MTRRGEIRRERVAAIVCARGGEMAGVCGLESVAAQSQKEETKERSEGETSAQISNLDDLITNRSRDVAHAERR